MNFYTAEILSKEVESFLKPYCKRIEIAGSVRRQCLEVNDIDIVIIQDSYKMLQYLLSTDAKNNQLSVHGIDLKSGPRHRQIRYKGEIIELWFAHESNFGLIHLIRTGSASFSQSMLAKWKEVSGGGYSEGGYLHNKDGMKIPTYEEMDVFKLCELDFIDPINRSFKNFIKL